MTISEQHIETRRTALRVAVPTWKPTTLHGRLDACAAQFGSRPFVLGDDSTLTYSDVVEESRFLAAGLAVLGVSPGDRVGVVMANYPEFVTIKFAISRAGAIAAPFNFLYKQSELAYVLADSGCRVLVTMTGFDGLDYQSMLDRIAPGWDSADFADGASPTMTHCRHCGTSWSWRRKGRPVQAFTRSPVCPHWDLHTASSATASRPIPTRPPTSSTPAGPRELRRA